MYIYIYIYICVCVCIHIYIYILTPNPEPRPASANLTFRSLCVKQSTGHTHTGHTDRENIPDTGTHTRTTRLPNEHLPPALNNAQRWRDDGACHLARPGGWPRRSQHERIYTYISKYIYIYICIYRCLSIYLYLSISIYPYIYRVNPQDAISPRPPFCV